MEKEVLFKKAQKVMPGGVSSPVRSFKSVGGIPPFIRDGQGAILTDSENKKYIDFVGSYGPAILGHCNPDVIKAIKNQCEKGLCFGAPSELETELASLIIEAIDSIEKVRFTNSGTEAALTAIRLARGYTNKTKVIKFEGCYHGHVDSLLVKSGSGALTLGIAASRGIPKETVAPTITLEFNNTAKLIEAFKKYGEDIAAIFVEPIAGNMGCIPASLEFLETAKNLAKEYGSLLVFDEVMTGFRVGKGSAQKFYDIQPDLTLLGKIIGGGLPVGAVGGRSDIMDMLAPSGPVYQAGTLSGNPISMTAGIATLKKLKSDNFYPTLLSLTEKLTTGIRVIANQHDVPLVCNHVCGMFGLFFSSGKSINCLKDVEESNLETFNKFFHLMLANGINFAPSPFEAAFVSIAHDEKIIEQTLTKTELVFSKLK